MLRMMMYSPSMSYAAADKGAEHIDRVFYYTGDYTGIESMDIGDLQKIIDNSVLLWSK